MDSDLTKIPVKDVLNHNAEFAQLKKKIVKLVSKDLDYGLLKLLLLVKLPMFLDVNNAKLDAETVITM